MWISVGDDDRTSGGVGCGERRLRWSDLGRLVHEWLDLGQILAETGGVRSLGRSGRRVPCWLTVMATLDSCMVEILTGVRLTSLVATSVGLKEIPQQLIQSPDFQPERLLLPPPPPPPTPLPLPKPKNLERAGAASKVMSATVAHSAVPVPWPDIRASAERSTERGATAASSSTTKAAIKIRRNPYQKKRELEMRFGEVGDEEGLFICKGALDDCDALITGKDLGQQCMVE
ncbi:hypothetical protein AKJ16_DCAP21399 [Drosera capensis]